MDPYLITDIDCYKVITSHFRDSLEFSISSPQDRAAYDRTHCHYDCSKLKGLSNGY